MGGNMEQSKVQRIIKNIAFILILDLILFPLAVALYLFHGFHIAHVVIGMGFVYGLLMVFDTANLLYKHIRVVNDPIHDETQSEHFYNDDEESPFCCQGDYDGTGCTCKSYREQGESEEELKPEMKQAMDEVFGINKGNK